MNGADFKYEGPVKREKQDQPIISEARQEEVARAHDLRYGAVPTPEEQVEYRKRQEAMVQRLKAAPSKEAVQSRYRMTMIAGLEGKAPATTVAEWDGPAPVESQQHAPGKMFSRETILAVLKSRLALASWGTTSEEEGRQDIREAELSNLIGIFARME